MRERPLRFPPHVVRRARAHGVRYDRLRITEESRYSCLKPDQFDQVVEIYARELGGRAPRRIIDATANVGCDTFQLKRMYPEARVTALEIDPATAALLALNAADLGYILNSVGGVGPPVEVRCLDCVDYLCAGRRAPRADLVYFDPPWGGPDYYKAAALRLALSGAPLGDVVGRTLARVAPLAVVKAPANADLAELRAAVGRHVEAAYTAHDVRRPRASKKGPVAFRLLFIRAAPRRGPGPAEEERRLPN
jgi:hypothetical protein